MLDLDLIKQQADHGILDISKLAQSIVGFLSKMCAPARDEQAKKILLNEDIVDLFRWADKKLENMNEQKAWVWAWTCIIVSYFHSGKCLAW